MAFEREPTVSVSLTQKVGLPNYGSAEAHIAIYNLPADAPEEMIESLLATGALAYNRLAGVLKQRVTKIREDNGL